MKNTTRFEDYTESEFLDFLGDFFEDGRGKDLKCNELDKFMNVRVEHFETVTEHPAASDLLFYPEEGQEDSPEGILKTVKEWRAANNKPGFKPE